MQHAMLKLGEVVPDKTVVEMLRVFADTMALLSLCKFGEVLLAHVIKERRSRIITRLIDGLVGQL